MNRTHLRHDLFTMAAASLGLLLTACGGAAAQPDAAMTGSEGTCSAHGASMQEATCSTSAPMAEGEASCGAEASCSAEASCGAEGSGEHTCSAEASCGAEASCSAEGSGEHTCSAEASCGAEGSGEHTCSAEMTPDAMK